MELTYLQYFLRVAELGSINRAALDLGLSQPALSRNIAALEHEVGAVLFTRRRSGVVLTEAGQVLADRARTLLGQFSLLKEEVGQKAAGQVTLGLPQAWQNVFTIAFLETFVQRHPAVALKIYDGVSNTLRDYLLSGMLDICIMPFEPLSPHGYAQTPLVREPMIALGHQAAGFSPDEEVPLTALGDAWIIMPGRANVLRQYVEQAFLRKGLRMRAKIEPSTQDLCIECARQGLGITVIPASSIQGYANTDNISWGPLKGVYATWSLYENEARAHSEAVRAARLLITQALNERPALWFGAQLLGPLGPGAPAP